MAYSLSFALDLGTSGLTLKAALVSAGTIHATFRDVAATFYADSQGGYEFLTEVIPDGFRGMMVFYTGTLGNAANFNGVTIYSRASVNPQETENADTKTSTRSGHSVSDIWAATVRTLTHFGFSTSVDAGAIADAVWNEPMSEHLLDGSTGATLATAGNAILPTPAPPPADMGLCRVYGYFEDLTNRLPSSDVEVRFSLTEAGPVKSDRLIVGREAQAFIKSGALSTSLNPTLLNSWIDLQRNDLLTPSGTAYRVVCPEIGLAKPGKVITLTTPTFDLASIV